MDEPVPGRAGAPEPSATGEPAMAAALGVAPPGYAKPTPLQFQYRVLKAIVLRDMSARYGEHRVGYLMGIFTPLVTLTFIIVIFQLRGRLVPSNFSLGVFIVTGYPLWLGFMDMYQKVLQSAGRTDPLLMFPQITQLDLILAAVILEFATNTVVYFILCLGIIVIMHDSPPADPFGVLLLFWSCLWLGAAFGLILCALQRAAPMAVTLLNRFARFGMWVSGVIYSVNRLPTWIWPYLSWNPILHAVEGTRTLWNPAFQAPIFTPSYIVIVAFVMTTIGFVLERATRRLVGQ